MIAEPRYKLLTTQYYKVLGGFFMGLLVLFLASLALHSAKLSVSLFCVLAAYMTSVTFRLLTFTNIKRFGLKRSVLLFRIKNRLEIQLLDARIFVERRIFSNEDVRFVKVPRITIYMNDDFNSGYIEIENTIKFNTKLAELDVSASLFNFVSEEQVFEKDMNTLRIRISNSTFDRSLKFRSINEFIDFWRKSENHRYRLFIDKELTLKRSSILVVGRSGSGKSYFLYSLILEAIMSAGTKNLWLLDPKNSSIAQIGKHFNSERYAGNNEDILVKLEEIYNLTMNRKEEIEPLMKRGLDKDYSSFELAPITVVFDEFASFRSWLNTQPKEKQNLALKTINTIILEGRQIGVHLVMALQKSDAQILPTHLRENFLFSVVLGSSGEQTYVTAFGQEIASSIPKRDITTGTGWYTTDSSSVAKIMSAPILDFDIFEGFEKLVNIIKAQKKGL